MIFTISYRDKNGRKASIDIEAQSKADVWPELKRRGISAISVSEGSQAKKKVNKVSFNRTFLTTFVIATIGIGVIYLLLNLPESKEGIATPAVDTKPKVQTVKESPRTVKTKAPAEKPKDEKMHFGVPHSEWVKLTRAEKVALGQAAYDAEAAKIDSTYLERKRAHDAEIAARPFKYTSENVIANIFSLDYGDNVLMVDFHPTLQEDFIKSFNEPIVINEEDDDATKQLKRDMIELKPKIKALLDKGHTLPEILDDYRKSIAKVHELEVNLRKELDQIKRTATSVDEVKDYIEAANKMMLDAGAKTFTYDLSEGAIRKIMINAERAERGEIK